MLYSTVSRTLLHLHTLIEIKYITINPNSQPEGGSGEFSFNTERYTACKQRASLALPRRLYSVVCFEPLTNVSVSERVRAGVEKWKQG